jgi:dihydrodipicolinate synthase/N-acetylneuraminate lyase
MLTAVPSGDRIQAMPRQFDIIAALLTPFTAAGEVDAPALRAHLGRLADAGIDGVMTAGTTGEGPLLTDDETLTVLGEAIAAVGGRLRVYAHVGRIGTAATADLARRSVALGADAVTAVCPFYYAVSQADLVDHFRALVGAVPQTPAFAYNIPRSTGNDLEIDAVRRLADAGLRGIKDSTRDADRHRELTELAHERDGAFVAYMGSDGLIREAFAMGGDGIVSSIANVAPDLVRSLRDALLAADDAESERLGVQLAELRKQTARSPIVAFKRLLADAAAVNGSPYPAHVRLPLGPAGA